MTEPDPGQQASLEERLEDHLDRRVAQLIARALRGDYDDGSGLGLATIAGSIAELLRATQLLEDTRPRPQRFVDAIAYAHRDNSRRRAGGEDVCCGCRLTDQCVRLDVSPRLLARLCGFDDTIDASLVELNATGGRYDPGATSLTVWHGIRELELTQRLVVPRARERLVTSLMWTLGERLPAWEFELGEAAAALSDLGWMGEDLADEFCDAVEEAHDRLHTPERLKAFGMRTEPGRCACRTTETCHSSALSPRSIARQLVKRGLIEELADLGLDERLIEMDVTGRTDPAEVTTRPPPVEAARPAVVATPPIAQRSQRTSSGESVELQAEILAVLRASPTPLAARDVAAATECDLDGRRAGQLLRRLRERGLVERHSFSDENTGWTHTTWTAIAAGEQW